jgi:amino-acid N-acetyltransferase
MLRSAGPSDAGVVHRLITDNLEAGHLLPRTLDDVERHASRFVVAESPDGVIGCAELAPLSDTVVEVRSLVVQQDYRGRRIGTRLLEYLATEAAERGFATLCAFTHEPSHFVRMGFTIVPHVWVPEKIAHDCTSCVLFRRCGQYAVLLPLHAGVSMRPERPAAVIHGGRAIAARRRSIERLRLRPVAAEADTEAVPA